MADARARATCRTRTRLCSLSKFSSSYCVLLLGRLCGGLAYSILYSSFESWAVEQSRRMLPGGAASQARVLEQVFSDATTVREGWGDRERALLFGLHSLWC